MNLYGFLLNFLAVTKTVEEKRESHTRVCNVHSTTAPNGSHLIEGEPGVFQVD